MNNKKKTQTRKKYPTNLKQELMKLWESYDFVEILSFCDIIR